MRGSRIWPFGRVKVYISDNAARPPLSETQDAVVISDTADGAETKPFWKRQTGLKAICGF